MKSRKEIKCEFYKMLEEEDTRTELLKQCVRDDFTEYELATCDCKHECVCDFTGSCPLIALCIDMEDLEKVSSKTMYELAEEK